MLKLKLRPTPVETQLIGKTPFKGQRLERRSSRYSPTQAITI